MPRAPEFFKICAVIAILTYAFISGCGQGDKSQIDDPSQIGISVEFSTIDADSNSGIESFRTVLLLDGISWAAFWTEHKKNTFPMPEPPAVDFSQKILVGIFLGFRPSGCYSVNITSIRLVEGQKLLVIYHENTPPGNSGCAAVVTFPSHIVSVKKSDLPVEFIAQ